MILPNNFVTFLTTTHSGVLKTPELDAEKITQWANEGFGSLTRAILAWVEPYAEIQTLPPIDVIEEGDMEASDRLQKSRKIAISMRNSSRSPQMFQVEQGSQVSQHSPLGKALAKLYKGTPDMAGSNLQVAVILSPRPSGRATTALFSTLRSGDPFLVISQVIKNGKRNPVFEKYILSNCGISAKWEQLAVTYFHFVLKTLKNSEVTNIIAQRHVWDYIRENDVPASVLNSLSSHYDVPDGMFDGKLNSIDICSYDLTNLVKNTKVSRKNIKFSDDMDSFLYDAFKSIFDNKRILSSQQWLTQISNAQRFTICCLNDERFASLSFEKLTRLITQEMIDDILVAEEDKNSFPQPILSSKLFSILLLRASESLRVSALKSVNRQIELLSADICAPLACFRGGERPAYNFNSLINFDGVTAETILYFNKMFLPDFNNNPTSILSPLLACNINIGMLGDSLVADDEFKQRFNSACTKNNYLPTLITCASTANTVEYRDTEKLLQNLTALFGQIKRNLHLELLVANVAGDYYLANPGESATIGAKNLLVKYLRLIQVNKPNIMMAIAVNQGWQQPLLDAFKEAGLSYDFDESIGKISTEIKYINWLGHENTYAAQFLDVLQGTGSPALSSQFRRLNDLQTEFMSATNILAQSLERPDLNVPIQQCVDSLICPNGMERDLNKDPVTSVEFCNELRASDAAMNSLRQLFTSKLTILGLLENIEKRHTGHSPGLNEAFEHYHQRYACQQVRFGKSM